MNWRMVMMVMLLLLLLLLLLTLLLLLLAKYMRRPLSLFSSGFFKDGEPVDRHFNT
jgi:hypothetical protein